VFISLKRERVCCYTPPKRRKSQTEDTIQWMSQACGRRTCMPGAPALSHRTASSLMFVMMLLWRVELHHCGASKSAKGQ
jgi:hypothetical protein